MGACLILAKDLVIRFERLTSSPDGHRDALSPPRRKLWVRANRLPIILEGLLLGKDRGGFIDILTSDLYILATNHASLAQLVRAGAS